MQAFQFFNLKGRADSSGMVCESREGFCDGMIFVRLCVFEHDCL